MGIFSSSDAVRAKKLRKQAKSAPSSVAIDELENLLSSDDETARTHAAAALGEIAEKSPERLPTVVDTLAQLLTDRHKHARVKAAGAIAALPEQNLDDTQSLVEDLEKMLTEETKEAKKNAVLALGSVVEWRPEAVTHINDETVIDIVQIGITEDIAPPVSNILTTIRDRFDSDNLVFGDIRKISPQDINEKYNIELLSDRIAYLSYESELYAVDITRGTQNWARDFSVTSTLIEEGDILCLYNDDKIRAFDRTSGRQVWSSEERKWSFDSTTGVRLKGDFLLLYDSSAITALDIESGDEKWSFKSHFDIENVKTGDNVLLLYNSSTITALELGSGEHKWSFGSKFRRKGIQGPNFDLKEVETGENVFLLDDSSTITALDIESGDEKWSFKTDSAMTGLRPAGDVLLLYNSSTITALDIESREEKWSFKADFTIERILPADDVLLLYNSSTITALELGSGEHRWSYESEPRIDRVETEANVLLLYYRAYDRAQQIRMLDLDSGDQYWSSGQYLTSIDSDISYLGVSNKVLLLQYDTSLYALDISFPEINIKIIDCPETIEKDNQVPLTVKLTNRHKKTETEVLQVQAGDTNLKTELVTLDPGQSTEVDVVIDTEMLKPGSHEIVAATEHGEDRHELEILEAPNFEISNIEIISSNATEGNEELTASVTNTGNMTGSKNVTIKIDDFEEVSGDVKLDAGERKTFSVPIPAQTGTKINVEASTPDDEIHRIVHLSQKESPQKTQAPNFFESETKGPSKVPDLSLVPSPSFRPDLTYNDLNKKEVLGKGGQAVVNRASLPNSKPMDSVAVKEPAVPPKTLTRDHKASFFKEAQTWKKLAQREQNRQVQHTNHIVGVVGIGEDTPWIAMEYMDGGSLAGRLNDNQNGLPIHEALWIAECLCRGLKLAHENGVAHLDLKPANILFRETPDETWNVPKIADWGLSRALIDDYGNIDAFSIPYVAPEHFDHDRFGQPNNYTDIYQLGVVSYELLTGRPPYTGTEAEVKSSVMSGDSPKPPSSYRAEIPEILDKVVLRALSTKKSQRYRGSIGRLEDAFRAVREKNETTVEALLSAER